MSEFYRTSPGGTSYKFTAYSRKPGKRGTRGNPLSAKVIGDKAFTASTG